MASDAFPLGEECHHGGTQADVQLRSHQRVGHGVVVAFDLHVGIDIDAGEFPFGIRIVVRRQGPERRAVECGKQLLA